MQSIFALLLVAMLGSAGTAAAEVHLTMRAGRVTLKATNATVPEILAEWAKVGQARIVNGEMIAGGPISIELTDVPEGQALDVILRSVAGYMAVLRPTAMANASVIDRIIILPTSTPPRVAASASPSPTTVQQPPQYTSFPPDNDDDPRDGVTPNPPLFNIYPTYPQPLPAGVSPLPAPIGGGAPAGSPTPRQMPVGVSIPGMIVQPAQQNSPGYPPNQTRIPQE